MSIEEDNELRDLIIQTLENKGILGKLKAELRANVFLALEEHKDSRDIPSSNPKLEEYIKSEAGCLVVSLFRDFLQHFNLDFTLAVFEPEISAARHNLLPTSELEKKYGKLHKDSHSPLITSLVKIPSQAKEPLSNPRSLDDEAEGAVQENFSHYMGEPAPRQSSKPTPDFSPLFYDFNQNNFEDTKELDDFFNESLPKEDEARSIFSIPAEKIKKPTTWGKFSPSTIGDIDSDQRVFPILHKDQQEGKTPKEMDDHLEKKDPLIVKSKQKLDGEEPHSSKESSKEDDPKSISNDDEDIEEIIDAFSDADITSDTTLHSSLSKSEYDHMENLGKPSKKT